jgi:hypothetical protein
VARDGREEGGEDNNFLYCQLITVGLSQKPTVIAPHHCRFVARTGSDVDFCCWFLANPNHFLILKLRINSEGLSLPVLQKPALMVSTVNVEYVVVQPVRYLLADYTLRPIIDDILAMDMRIKE